MASLDVLVLGPFVFTDFAVPDRLPFGGKHQLTIHKMPGGNRVIDAMGSDDDDRSWSGILWGEGAAGDALTLDALRRAGTPLGYSNGMEARTVVISSFTSKLQKFNVIDYEITVVMADNPTAGLGGIASLASMVLSDLSAAAGFLS